MELEINPFFVTVVNSNEPITSIQITSNLDWLTLPALALGPEAVIDLSASATTPALKVFGTGVGVGVPSMISLTAGHIPNIAISQVTGLQSAINALVKTFVSGNTTALTITNNGVGDYTATPQFGTIANKIAQGNDTRFPANVSGLRKSSGLASTDVAAVAKVDYWDTTVAVASGASHAKGLVPDPGASAGTTKYLREDMTFVVPPGSGTVTSVALTLPSFLSVTGSPITTTGTLAVTLATQVKNTFLVGPVSGSNAAPAFRVFDYQDISAIVGTGASNVAQGNDTRFPASVTGLRKSSGAGSTDVAALAGVDFAAATVFGAKGASHSVGLVPDPGIGSPPYVRYLRDDSTWTVFVPDTHTLTNSMMATMPAQTIKGNPTGGVSDVVDITVKQARSSALLNIESITTHGDSDYTVLSTDKYVATSATLTADRTWTLPLANTFNSGQSITFADDFGGVGSFKLKIARSGSDLIQGSSTAVNIAVSKGSMVLVSDGNTKWSVARKTPGIVRTIFTATATYTTPTGVKALFVEVIGGGGGGGGAFGGSSQASIGGGGGAGGYANKFYNNPGASYAMTVGAGGAGGVGAASGSTGGTTQFAGDIISQGGNGGATLATGTSQTFVAPGFGGISTSGDLQLAGTGGTHGIRLSGTSALSGTGAPTEYCPAATGLFVSSANGNSTGVGYGGGGGGALSYSAVSETGGAGTQGAIIVTEYY